MGRFKELEIEQQDRLWRRWQLQLAKERRLDQERLLVASAKKLKTEVISDGVTVWVNSDQGNLARFGRRGIDIHRPPLQMQQKGECLFCTHETVTAQDWHLFVAKVKEHYGVTVHEEHRPDRFKGSP